MNNREFGSEFYLNKEDLNFTDLKKYDDDILYFRSGRDSLRIVALDILDKVDKILLPAFCCESMVKPFLDVGIKVEFYKLTNDLLPDILHIESLLNNKSAILYMDFFGVEKGAIKCLENIKTRYSNTIIIEDRTQDIFASKNYNIIKPDYIVASIRKWLAIPDGGMVIGKFEKKLKCLDSESEFSIIRKKALILKGQYIKEGGDKLKERFRGMFNRAEKLLNEDTKIYYMTNFSKNIYNRADYRKICDIRIRNYNYLYSKLFYISNIDLSLIGIQESPLYFPILIDKRDFIQKRLAECNIYCPVIWPIPEEAKGICKNSEYISKNILAIPCDQRYSIEDINYISNKLIAILLECNGGGLI